MSAEVIRNYIDAWNARDLDRMIELVSDDILHRINQGGTRQGKEAFAAFLRHVAEHYEERLDDVVILTGPDGRCGSEFTVHGIYRKTDDDMPRARGQRYTLPGAILCDTRDGRITRLSVFFNMADWRRQIA